MTELVMRYKQEHDKVIKDFIATDIYNECIPVMNFLLNKWSGYSKANNMSLYGLVFTLALQQFQPEKGAEFTTLLVGMFTQHRRMEYRKNLNKKAGGPGNYSTIEVINEWLDNKPSTVHLEVIPDSEDKYEEIYYSATAQYLTSVAFNTLSPMEYKVFILCFLQDHSNASAAREVGVSRQAIGKTIKRIKIKLKKFEGKL